MNNERKKILCVCEAGIVRSTSLAAHLKHDRGTPLHDAIAIGWRLNSPEVMSLLCDWADMIIVMESYMREEIPFQFLSKVEVCDVGPDTYGSPFNNDLLDKVEAWADRMGLKNC